MKMEEKEEECSVIMIEKREEKKKKKRKYGEGKKMKRSGRYIKGLTDFNS